VSKILNQNSNEYVYDNRLSRDKGLAVGLKMLAFTIHDLSKKKIIFKNEPSIEYKY